MLLNREPFVLGDPDESFQGPQIGYSITQLPMPIVPLLICDGWEESFSEKTGSLANHLFPV
jgi:hypothetical protein